MRNLTAAPTTICTKCRYHANTDRGQDGPSDIWYYQVCTNPAFEHASVIDPVDGTVRYATRNGLGTPVLTRDKHPNCRDVNDGNCPMYKAK